MDGNKEGHTYSDTEGDCGVPWKQSRGGQCGPLPVACSLSPAAAHSAAAQQRASSMRTADRQILQCTQVYG